MASLIVFIIKNSFYTAFWVRRYLSMIYYILERIILNDIRSLTQQCSAVTSLFFVVDVAMTVFFSCRFTLQFRLIPICSWMWHVIVVLYFYDIGIAVFWCTHTECSPSTFSNQVDSFNWAFMLFFFEFFNFKTVDKMKSVEEKANSKNFQNVFRRRTVSVPNAVNAFFFFCCYYKIKNNHVKLERLRWKGKVRMKIEYCDDVNDLFLS